MEFRGSRDAVVTNALGHMATGYEQGYDPRTRIKCL